MVSNEFNKDEKRTYSNMFNPAPTYASQPSSMPFLEVYSGGTYRAGWRSSRASWAVVEQLRWPSVVIALRDMVLTKDDKSSKRKKRLRKKTASEDRKS